MCKKRGEKKKKTKVKGKFFLGCCKERYALSSSKSYKSPQVFHRVHNNCLVCLPASFSTLIAISSVSTVSDFAVYVCIYTCTARSFWNLLHCQATIQLYWFSCYDFSLPLQERNYIQKGFNDRNHFLQGPVNKPFALLTCPPPLLYSSDGQFKLMTNYICASYLSNDLKPLIIMPPFTTNLLNTAPSTLIT